MQQWIAAARRAEGEALGKVLEHFRAYLLLVANRELAADVRAKVGASDLVQETLLKAHNNFGRFHGQSEEELRTWLRRILLNHMANVTEHYHGTGKRELAREITMDPDALAEAVISESDTPHRAALRRERNAELQQALEQLPEHYRQVIDWRNYDRLSFEEIGRRLNCSAEAARKVWTRAVNKLGDILEPLDESQG